MYERITYSYLALMSVASVLALGAYGIDKRRSVRQQRRIPEKTLHALALLGGWPGAWLGQRAFRHKTKKRRFRLVFFGIVGLHAALLYVWIRFVSR